MEHWGFLIEGGIFGGAAIAWGVWQLWSLKREAAKDKAKAESAASAPRHPEG